MFLHLCPSSLSSGLPTTTISPKITPLKMHFLINASQKGITTLTLHKVEVLDLEMGQFFSLFYFTFIMGLFSFSSLSAIKVISSAYLRLLIFLPAILILVCVAYSPIFCMMYFAYKLSKQDDISLDILISQFGTSLLFHV